MAKIRLYLTSVLICYTPCWCLQSLNASEVVAGFADSAQIDLTYQVINILHSFFEEDLSLTKEY